MAFNPLQNYLGGKQAEQQQQANTLAGRLAGQAQNPEFRMGQSTDFRNLMAIDPDRANKTMETFQNLSESRKKAYFDDMVTGKAMLDAGDLSGFGKFQENRLENLKRLGSDDITGTEMVIDKFNQGDIAGLQQGYAAGIDAGRQLGYIKPDARQGAKKSGEDTALIKNYDRLEKLKKTGTKEQVAVFEKMAGLLKDPKMSASLEKQLVKAQDDFFKFSEQARQMDVLANDINSIDISGGLKSSLSETFKSILGSTEEVTALRQRFNAIRTSQATANLPPGSASDKDIQLALSGFPKENANAETIVSFLRGQKKLAKVNEKFAEFKANFYAVNKSPSGLVPAWKNYAQSTSLFGGDGDVNEAAIEADYTISPEDETELNRLKAKFGVQ